MAGMKGRSGGARPGAGRKKKPPVLLTKEPPAKDGEPDSLRVLRAIANDENLDYRTRLDAAKALAPYEAARKGEGGKKEQRQGAAKKAGTGRFAPAPPPGIVIQLRGDDA